ncbi:hypothetical protein [Agrococcus sp. KRD186]|uniref:hypothetical protein n=1 Tax=Agrococcus sp. KRD186 TaxID=2729730 RepID=UPI0019D2CFE8|nr:hypothetical protein [Agrococcus sp. KRD186]
MQNELPESLRARGFTVVEARAQGVPPGTLRNGSLATPYRGIRTVERPKTLVERAAAFAPLLRPWQALGGISALATLGLPVPWRMGSAKTVEVVSATGRGYPSRAGVRVRRISVERFEAWEIDGLRAAAAPLAWALMAGRCTVHELVVIGDAIVSNADNYPDRRLPGPLATLDELQEVTEQRGGKLGAASLRAALPRIRERVESPRETDMRLFIVDAGLPEPEVQAAVHDPQSGRLLGRADLMHREARVVEEYEGDGHRSKQQWDRDIEKYREFARIGLHVVRATNRDFVPSPERWLLDLEAVLDHRSLPPLRNDGSKQE